MADDDESEVARTQKEDAETDAQQAGLEQPTDRAELKVTFSEVEKKIDVTVPGRHTVKMLDTVVAVAAIAGTVAPPILAIRAGGEPLPGSLVAIVLVAQVSVVGIALVWVRRRR